MRSGNASSEHRCYVHMPLYSYPLLGMVDTDADKSYMGGRAVRLCQSLNIPIDKFTEPQCVQLADQSAAEVMVSVKIPIELQGKTHLITCLILPNLCRCDCWIRLLVQARCGTKSR
jgi:hypothetical protein